MGSQFTQQSLCAWVHNLHNSPFVHGFTIYTTVPKRTLLLLCFALLVLTAKFSPDTRPGVVVVPAKGHTSAKRKV